MPKAAGHDDEPRAEAAAQEKLAAVQPVSAPNEASGQLPFVRNKAALAVLALTATVGISASVAAFVASAIIASSSAEPKASFSDQPALAARRLEKEAAASAGAVGEGAIDSFCLDALEGEMCHRLVQWIMEDGVRFNPDKYRGITSSSPFHEAQALAHLQHPDLCSRPCSNGTLASKEAGPKVENFLQCDYGHQDSKPHHAGCFVVHNGRVLAERLTYDGSRYDIPGGQTDGREPARCTAYRETYEETGYLVAPRELLGVFRGDFHLYRCELLRSSPVKGHDHEIQWVGWLDANEVRAKVSQGMWRFPEANRYANWIR